MQYLVIIEKGPTSYGAYLPDVPGCVAVGTTKAEVKRLIGEALQLHLDSLRQQGLPAPVPNNSHDFVTA